MAGKRDEGTEVVGLMRTNTSDNAKQPSLNPAKTPKLERHISSIPQDSDNEEANSPKTKNPLKKLKNKIADRSSHRHENHQPQKEENATEESLTGPNMPTKLKRNISSIPMDDYDSESEKTEAQPQPQPQKDDRHDSGVSNGSEFEVAPMLRISSDEAERPNIGTKRPELERHISKLSDGDGEDERKGGLGRGGMSRIERTISQIPRDDYDSDD